MSGSPSLPTKNIDHQTVAAFGVEWSRFDHSETSEAALVRYFEQYFEIFPWGLLPANAVGFDLGCGSGRWSRFVSARVGTLHCMDASAEALAVARRNLASRSNCVFHHVSVDSMDVPDASMDFGYSLGVLHHVPDTPAGIRACVSKLKPGAPFLLYLYYALENRPSWYRAIWRTSDEIRRMISHLPDRAKLLVSDGIAASVYFPLARLAAAAEKLGAPVEAFPLSHYRRASFYTMRNDALDRFGTRLEQRFTADQIKEMMTAAGLEGITFRPGPPYWCALGYRRQ